MQSISPASASESFLSAQLRDFYREVIRWKQQIESDPGAFRAAGAAPAEVDAATVWQALLGVLERQAIAVRRTGGEYAAEVYREAQYLMAALADEVFLHLDWRGRDDWQANLLEQRLFGSHNAGDVVFQRIERILRTRDPLEGELARLYLVALGLGFQGRYRGTLSAGRLDEMRRQLYAFVANEDPDAPREARPLFPGAYASTLEAGRGAMLARPGLWILAIVLLLVAWVFVSQQVWKRNTGDLSREMQRIARDESSGSPAP